MRIANRIVFDIATGAVLERDSFEYTGPVCQAISAGDSESYSKSKSRSNQQATSQSGTQFNEDFLNKALGYFGGKKSTPEEKAALQQQRDAAKQAYDTSGSADRWQRGEDLKKADFDLNAANAADLTPDYNAPYVGSTFTPGTFTGANYTPVDGGNFDVIERNLYGGQQSRLKQAYDETKATQREQLAQSGALNSPSQYLEGSAGSSVDRSYLQSLQQAARDASTTALGLKAQEAARKTNFDVGQGAARTAFDVGQGTARTAYSTGEGERQTGYNERTAQALLDTWFKKLALAIESGRFSTGQSTGQSSSDSMSQSTSRNASFMS